MAELFKNPGRLYVYPSLDFSTGKIVTAETFPVKPELKHLYTHLLENGFIQSITNSNPEFLRIRSRDILDKMAAGDASWEEMVPPPVVAIIRREGLYGCAALG